MIYNNPFADAEFDAYARTKRREQYAQETNGRDFYKDMGDLAYDPGMLEAAAHRFASGLEGAASGWAGTAGEILNSDWLRNQSQWLAKDNANSSFKYVADPKFNGMGVLDLIKNGYVGSSRGLIGDAAESFGYNLPEVMALAASFTPPGRALKVLGSIPEAIGTGVKAADVARGIQAGKSIAELSPEITELAKAYKAMPSATQGSGLLGRIMSGAEGAAMEYPTAVNYAAKAANGLPGTLAVGTVGGMSEGAAQAGSQEFIEELRQRGQELGYEGEALNNFVRNGVINTFGTEALHNGLIDAAQVYLLKNPLSKFAGPDASFKRKAAANALGALGGMTAEGIQEVDQGAIENRALGKYAANWWDPGTYQDQSNEEFGKAFLSSAPLFGGFAGLNTAKAALDKFNSVNDLADAIEGQESGGNANATNQSSGAHGRYQIMPQNWNSWRDEAKAAGVDVGSGEEDDPAAQEAVAKFKMDQYKKQFGSDEAVAVAWYAGPDSAQKWVDGSPVDAHGVPWDTPQEDGPSIKEYVESVMGRKADNGGGEAIQPHNLAVQAGIDTSNLKDGWAEQLPIIGGILKAAGLGDSQISSTARTPEHNAEVGGAENSYHVRGDAVDIVLPDDTPAEQAEAIRQKFEDTGAFTEVLFHDAGSGYHLHLGGLKGSLAGTTAPSPQVAPGATQEATSAEDGNPVEAADQTNLGERKENGLEGEPLVPPKQGTEQAQAPTPEANQNGITADWFTQRITPDGLDGIVSPVYDAGNGLVGFLHRGGYNFNTGKIDDARAAQSLDLIQRTVEAAGGKMNKSLKTNGIMVGVAFKDPAIASQFAQAIGAKQQQSTPQAVSPQAKNESQPVVQNNPVQAEQPIREEDLPSFMRRGPVAPAPVEANNATPAPTEAQAAEKQEAAPASEVSEDNNSLIDNETKQGLQANNMQTVYSDKFEPTVFVNEKAGAPSLAHKLAPIAKSFGGKMGGTKLWNGVNSRSFRFPSAEAANQFEEAVNKAVKDTPTSAETKAKSKQALSKAVTKFFGSIIDKFREQADKSQSKSVLDKFYQQAVNAVDLKASQSNQAKVFSRQAKDALKSIYDERLANGFDANSKAALNSNNNDTTAPATNRQEANPRSGTETLFEEDKNAKKPADVLGPIVKRYKTVLKKLKTRGDVLRIRQYYIDDIKKVGKELPGIAIKRIIDTIDRHTNGKLMALKEPAMTNEEMNVTGAQETKTDKGSFSFEGIYINHDDIKDGRVGVILDSATSPRKAGKAVKMAGGKLSVRKLSTPGEYRGTATFSSAEAAEAFANSVDEFNKEPEENVEQPASKDGEKALEKPQETSKNKEDEKTTSSKEALQKALDDEMAKDLENLGAKAPTWSDAFFKTLVKKIGLKNINACVKGLEPIIKSNALDILGKPQTEGRTARNSDSAAVAAKAMELGFLTRDEFNSLLDNDVKAEINRVLDELEAHMPELFLRDKEVFNEHIQPIIDDLIKKKDEQNGNLTEDDISTATMQIQEAAEYIDNEKVRERAVERGKAALEEVKAEKPPAKESVKAESKPVEKPKAKEKPLFSNEKAKQNWLNMGLDKFYNECKKVEDAISNSDFKLTDAIAKDIAKLDAYIANLKELGVDPAAINECISDRNSAVAALEGNKVESLRRVRDKDNNVIWSPFKETITEFVSRAFVTGKTKDGKFYAKLTKAGKLAGENIQVGYGEKPQIEEIAKKHNGVVKNGRIEFENARDRNAFTREIANGYRTLTEQKLIDLDSKATPDRQETVDKVANIIRKIGIDVCTDPLIVERENGYPLSSSEGTVYGFVKNGRIYLNPKAISVEAPVHEFVHVWTNFIMKADPELWKKGKALLKQTQMWKDIEKNPAYENIWGKEDLIASEVCAQIAGKRGAAKIDEIVKNKSIAERLKNWVKLFWGKLKAMFGFGRKKAKQEGVKELTLDEFLDMPLKQLQSRAKMTALDPSNEVQRMFTKKDGIYNYGIGYDKPDFNVDHAVLTEFLGSPKDKGEGNKWGYIMGNPGDMPPGYKPKKCIPCYKLVWLHGDGQFHPLYAGISKPLGSIGEMFYAQGIDVASDKNGTGKATAPRYQIHFGLDVPTAPHLISPVDIEHSLKGHYHVNEEGHKKRINGRKPRPVFIKCYVDASNDYTQQTHDFSKAARKRRIAETKAGVPHANEAQDDHAILGLGAFGGYYTFFENNGSIWICSSGAMFADVLYDEDQRKAVLKEAGFDEDKAFAEWKLPEYQKKDITHYLGLLEDPGYDGSKEKDSKIRSRARAIEYVHNVQDMYRKTIELCRKNKWKEPFDFFKLKEDILNLSNEKMAEKYHLTSKFMEKYEEAKKVVRPGKYFSNKAEWEFLKKINERQGAYAEKLSDAQTKKTLREKFGYSTQDLKGENWKELAKDHDLNPWWQDTLDTNERIRKRIVDYTPELEQGLMEIRDRHEAMFAGPEEQPVQRMVDNTETVLTPEARKQADKVRQKFQNTPKWLKAPNGKPTNLNEMQWCLVRTPAFKKWFGNWESDPANASKAVDENGEPKVFYRGITQSYDVDLQPDPTWISESYTQAKNNYAECGIEFDEDDEDGEAKVNTRSTLAVFANIRNPFDIGKSEDEVTLRDFIDDYFAPAVKKALKEGRITERRYNLLMEDLEYLAEQGDEFSSAHEKYLWYNEEYREDFLDILKKSGYDAYLTTERYYDKSNFNTYGVIGKSNVKSAIDNNGNYSAEDDHIQRMVAPSKTLAENPELLAKEADNLYTEAISNFPNIAKDKEVAKLVKEGIRKSVAYSDGGNISTNDTRRNGNGNVSDAEESPTQRMVSNSQGNPGRRAGGSAATQSGATKNPVARDNSKRGSIVGLGITRALVRKGSISLVGQKANNIHELAEVAQILRSPGFETFSYIYANDDGEIVGHEAVSSRLPTCSKVVTKDDGESLSTFALNVAKKAKIYGATKIYIAHNHPSGNPTPSTADIRVTKAIAIALSRTKVKLAGHLIVDHTTYASFNHTANSIDDAEIHDLPFDAWHGKPSYDKAEKPHAVLGEAINSPGKLDLIANYIKQDGVAESVALVVTQKNIIRGVIKLHKDFNEMKPEHQLRYLRHVTRAAYGAHVFLVTPDRDIYNSLAPYTESTDEDGIVDIVLTDDGKIEHAFRGTTKRAWPNWFGVDVENAVGVRVLDNSSSYDGVQRMVALTPEADRQMKEVYREYRGTKKFMKAPNGKPTRLSVEEWLQVRTKNFKKWFGPWDTDPEKASKVLDENGEPLVVFHSGTFNEGDNLEPLGAMHFGTFQSAVDRGHGKVNDYDVEVEEMNNGRYRYRYLNTGRANEPWSKKTYASWDNAYDAATNKIDHLLESSHDDPEKAFNIHPYFLNIRKIKQVEDQGDNWDDVVVESISEGYDGLSYINEVEDSGSISYIALPNNIKSVDENNGEFDPSEPNIQRMVKPSFTPEAQKQMKAVKKQYQGTDGWLKAPNGKKTKLNEEQWLLVRTKNFKNWFGDWEADPGDWEKDSNSVSGAIDKNGEPMVYYHGTRADFTVFDTEEGGTARKPYESAWSAEYPDGTMFFTSNRKGARYYGGNVMPVFLKLPYATIRNVDYGESLVKPFDDEGLAFEGNAIVRRPDGQSVACTSDSYAIKSATMNNGEYSIQDNDIQRMVKSEDDKPIAYEDLPAAERKIVDEYLDSRPDGDIIRERLARHAGTPWDKQVVNAIKIRVGVENILEGKDPKIFSKLFKGGNQGIRRAAAKGWEGLWKYITFKASPGKKSNRQGFIGHPEKPGNAVNSSLLNCNPSDDCANYCYTFAPSSNYNFPTPAAKAELVTMLVEKDPIRAADMTAKEYKLLMGEKNPELPLRLFDKGDMSEAWVPFIKQLNNNGIKTQVFSKRPELLRKVDPNPEKNLVLLSVDASNYQIAFDNPELPIAIVYSGTQKDKDFINKMEDRFKKHGGSILPIVQGKRYLSNAELAEMPEWTKPYLCPRNSHKEDIETGNKIGEIFANWHCYMCYKDGGVGCCHGRTPEAIRKLRETAAEVENFDRNPIRVRIETVERILQRVRSLEGVPEAERKSILNELVDLDADLRADLANEEKHRASEGTGSGDRKGKETVIQRLSVPESQVEAVRKKYEGTKEWMKAPNGKPTNLDERQWLHVRTPSFKKWFGDWENDPKNASKAIDKNGEPLIVYHGSENGGFDAFDNDYNNSSTGIWLAADKEVAEDYATPWDDENPDDFNPQVYTLFANVKKPIIINAGGKSYIDIEGDIENAAMDDRYDGVIVNNVRDARYAASAVPLTTTINVHNPNQVKSATDNDGTYSTSDDHIQRMVVSDETSWKFDTKAKAAGDTLRAGVSGLGDKVRVAARAFNNKALKPLGYDMEPTESKPIDGVEINERRSDDHTHEMGIISRIFASPQHIAARLDKEHPFRQIVSLGNNAMNLQVRMRTHFLNLYNYAMDRNGKEKLSDKETKDLFAFLVTADEKKIVNNDAANKEMDNLKFSKATKKVFHRIRRVLDYVYKMLNEALLKEHRFTLRKPDLDIYRDLLRLNEGRLFAGEESGLEYKKDKDGNLVKGADGKPIAINSPITITAFPTFTYFAKYGENAGTKMSLQIRTLEELDKAQAQCIRDGGWENHSIEGEAAWNATTKFSGINRDLWMRTETIYGAKSYAKWLNEKQGYYARKGAPEGSFLVLRREVRENNTNPDQEVYVVTYAEKLQPVGFTKSYFPHLWRQYKVFAYKPGVDGAITKVCIGSAETLDEAVKFGNEHRHDKVPTDPSHEYVKITIERQMFNFEQLGVDGDQLAAQLGLGEWNNAISKMQEAGAMELSEASKLLKSADISKTSYTRFFGNLLERKDAQGYEREDIEWVLTSYLAMAARFIAMESEFKPSAVDLFENAYGNIDEEHHGDAGYAKDYIFDINGNPSGVEEIINYAINNNKFWKKYIVPYYGDRAAITLANSLATKLTHLCLGFCRLSTCLLNLSQIVNCVTYIGDIGAYHKILARTAKTLSGNAKGFGKPGALTGQSFKGWERAVLRDTDVLNDITMDSASGYDKNRSGFFLHPSNKFEKVFNKVADYGLKPFTLTDQAIRVGTVLAAYEKSMKDQKQPVAMKSTMTAAQKMAWKKAHKTAIDFAKMVNDKGNFNYSQADSPNIFRRGSVLAQLALQFKKYPIKELEVIADMLPIFSTDKSITATQKVMFWVPFMLMCGAMGIPALDWFDEIVYGITGKHPKVGMKKTVMESKAPDWAKRVVLYGALGAPSFGADISGRVGLGDVVPTSMSADKLLGPAYSKPKSVGDAFIKWYYHEGKAFDILKCMMPSTLADISNAFRGSSEDARGRLNYKYSVAELPLKLIGARPVGESVSADKALIQKEERMSHRQDVKDAIDAYLKDSQDKGNLNRIKELHITQKQIADERKKKAQSRTERTKAGLSKQESKDFEFMDFMNEDD